jgi:hypothetical protein
MNLFALDFETGSCFSRGLVHRTLELLDRAFHGIGYRACLAQKFPRSSAGTRRRLRVQGIDILRTGFSDL